MKDKSWIIILIMGIALAISIGYSIIISQRNSQIESTVTTTSIIEMTATTVTIKNTLTGTGNIEYKEIEETSTEQNNQIQEDENIETLESEEIKNSAYQIVLSIEDKDLEKVEVGQDVEITVKKDDENLNYTGKVIKINENTNNKSTLNVEVTNPDENIEENITATCTVIVEKAENVVALPIEAIQRNEEDETFVDVVQDDGTTISVIIETGISDDYYVEITSGLVVGDRVQIVKSTTTIVNDEENSNNINTVNLTSEK